MEAIEDVTACTDRQSSVCWLLCGSEESSNPSLPQVSVEGLCVKVALAPCPCPCPLRECQAEPASLSLFLSHSTGSCYVAGLELAILYASVQALHIREVSHSVTQAFLTPTTPLFPTPQPEVPQFSLSLSFFPLSPEEVNFISLSPAGFFQFLLLLPSLPQSL